MLIIRGQQNTIFNWFLIINCTRDSPINHFRNPVHDRISNKFTQLKCYPYNKRYDLHQAFHINIFLEICVSSTKPIFRSSTTYKDLPEENLYISC